MKINAMPSELKTKDDIWNAVLTAYSEYTPSFLTSDTKMDDYFILFNYFSELESGGHEGLLNWCSDSIEKIGIHQYVTRLTNMLSLVDANEYAEIEKNDLEKLWELYLALENTEVESPHYEKVEGDFYNLIEKMDDEYRNYGDKLFEHLYQFANKIYKDLI